MADRYRTLRLAITIGAAILLGGTPALAADEAKLTIRNQRFEPAELQIPAGKKIKLIVRNEDKTAEEFESFDLNREKVIPGGTEAVVYVGPLKPGTYKFFGEFHPETAQGTLIVK